MLSLKKMIAVQFIDRYVTVKTDKTSYSRGATVTTTVTVKDSSSLILLNGASVSLKITRNGQTYYSSSGLTNSAGTITFSYRLSNSAIRGTYLDTAAVTLSGYSMGTGQASFTVN